MKKFMHEFKGKMEAFDKGLEAARSISREATYKIVLLSASIVGFSATIQSIVGLKLNTNPTLLKWSWMLFVATIVVGPFMHFLESRAKYTVVWRGLQHQEQDWRDELSIWRKLQALLVLCYSVTLSPRSLLLCRIYKDPGVKLLRARQNALVVALTNLLFNLTLFMEIVFFALFIAALVVLVLSVGLKP